MPKPIEDLIAAAAGEEPSDLVLRNARVWNAFRGEFIDADVALSGGYIAGVGRYAGREEIDAGGKYLLPGFIDAHVHIESSMAAPEEFARALLRAGVTAAVVDPHEIANVAGAAGIAYLLQAVRNLPLRVFVMLPSCVPASGLDAAAAELRARDLAPFLNDPAVLGLGEMMNFPGVLARDPEVMAKLHLADGRPVDGHAPGLAAKALAAYAAAGIRSDHECTTADEAREKLDNGIAVMLRQGSAARDLLALLPAVTDANATWCMFATDDRNPHDLLTEGSINHMVRLALRAGQPLRRVLDMACLNAARHFGLRDLGAIAPGFRADLALYPDLETWRPELVLHGGRPVLRDGRDLWDARASAGASALRGSVHLGSIGPEQLALPAAGTTARVIGVLPGRLVTEDLRLEVPKRDGCFAPDPVRDIVKLSVWERHKGTGTVGAGLVRGLGLARGAIGSTVAHDSHHLIAAGADDTDILAVVRHLAQIGGGLAVAEKGRITGSLSLPLGGILSDRPLEEIRDGLVRLQDLAHELGVPAGQDPFMTLSFLALPVIPALKLTYNGLVDAVRFCIVSVDAGQAE